MSFKNYYKILEVASNATVDEIKKSYRKLALKYHPDRTFGDKVAEEKFKQVQEAYETLSNEGKRDNYNYEYNKEKEKYFAQKQQNASQDQTYQKKEEPKVTPYTFYRKFRDIRLSVDATAKESINQKALSDTLKNLLSDNCISFLLNSDDIKTNHEIIDEALEACKPLNISYFKEIGIRLTKLAANDNSIIQIITNIQKIKRLKSYWIPVKTFGGIALLIICVILAINNSHSTNSSPSYSNSTSTKEQSTSGDVYSTPQVRSTISDKAAPSQKLSSFKKEALATAAT